MGDDARYDDEIGDMEDKEMEVAGVRVPSLGTLTKALRLD